MRVIEFFNALELNNDFLLDDDVCPETFIELESSVLDGEGNLPLNL